MNSSICFVNLFFILHGTFQYANQRLPHVPIERIANKNKSLASQQFQHSMRIQPITNSTKLGTPKQTTNESILVQYKTQQLPISQTKHQQNEIKTFAT